MATRIYKTPFAATGDKETLATADQPDGKVSLQAGWTPDYELPNDDPNYRPVGRLEMNGILSEVTQGLGEVQLNGFAKWQAIDGGWPLGAWVSHNGTVYVSAAGNNTSEPGAGGSGWTTGFMGGVVGDARNAKMTVAAASAFGTFAADEVVVGTALGGQTYRLAAYNQTINLATNGAGGLDTGASPNSGYVALYAIYNPLTGARNILAVNATTTVAPTVYGGANMPAGYTTSALLSVWATDSGGLLRIGVQNGRRISRVAVQVLNTATLHPTFVGLDISAAIPPNAVRFAGSMAVASSAPGSTLTMALATDISGSGSQQNSNTVAGAQAVNVNYVIDASISQRLFYTNTNTTGTPSFSITISQYEI